MSELVVLAALGALGWLLLPPAFDTRVVRRQPVLGARALVSVFRGLR